MRLKFTYLFFIRQFPFILYFELVKLDLFCEQVFLHNLQEPHC